MRRPKPPADDHEMGEQPETCGTCAKWVQAQADLAQARRAASWSSYQRGIADAAERGRLFRENLWSWLQTEMPSPSRRS